MIYRSSKNINSHLTVKNRQSPSLPTRFLLKNNFLEGKMLDFGCGLGKDVEFLTAQNFDILGYDPYYQLIFPVEKFDVILCHYVLNVLLPEEQFHVLTSISELLKPTGKAFFTVRRDISKKGFRYNPKQNAETYQCNVVLPYKSVFKNENCEIYEYQHYTEINPQVFAEYFDNSYQLLTESATSLAVFSENQKQIEIFPKKLKTNYFDLSIKEQQSLNLILNRLYKKIDNFDYQIVINQNRISLIS